MFNFFYMNITGSVPFDLAFSTIAFFALNGFIIKTVRGLIFGRNW